ncbi:hypothetical protein ACS0TY_008632 [Phlomoides rotata]
MGKGNLSMKIPSYSIRGAGRRKEKRREVRDMVMNLKIEICCLQETKLEAVDRRLCKLIWGNRACDWACFGSEGNSGGILTLWNPDVFQKSSEWNRRGMVVVNGI